MEAESARAREVLEEALKLVSERGIAGASLRQLAQRLGISQPSLYHYFESKDALIGQLAELGATHMMDAMQVEALATLEPDAVPAYIKEKILELYRGERHIRFVRFLFVVAIEKPEHQETIQRVFERRVLHEPSEKLQLLLAEDPTRIQRLMLAYQMLSRAIALALMEDRILFGLKQPSPATLEFADFVADAVTRLVSSKD